MISPTPISLRERSKPSTPPRPASGVATAAEPTQNIFKRADDQGYPNCSPLRAHCDGIRKCDGCNTSQSHNGISIALVLSLALLGASPAAAGTRILVSYTWAETEVWPHQQTHREGHQLSFLLEPNGQVTVSTPGKFFEPGSKYKVGSVRHLGQGTTARDVVWHVENGALVRHFEYPSREIIERITTDGQTSCQFDLTVKLRPGFKFFETKRTSNGEEMKDSDEHAEGETCEIISE
jgi:hypothetical protein